MSSPHCMQRICEKQRDALRQCCTEFVHTARAGVSPQETHASARAAKERRMHLLCATETLHAIRAKSEELEEKCLASHTTGSVRSASMALEGLVSLHKQTMEGSVLHYCVIAWALQWVISGLQLQMFLVMCRGFHSVSSADVQRWHTRALRCMGLHTDNRFRLGSQTTSQVREQCCPARLRTDIEGFSETAVFQYMKLTHTLRATSGNRTKQFGKTLPGTPGCRRTAASPAACHQPVTSASRYFMAA